MLEALSAAQACGHSATRALVRVAAKVLFFEMAEKPTVRRVRALIGQGSWSTITDELQLFWHEVRSAANQPATLVSPTGMGSCGEADPLKRVDAIVQDLAAHCNRLQQEMEMLRGKDGGARRSRGRTVSPNQRQAKKGASDA